MYTSIPAFAAMWKMESDKTRAILNALTDASLGQAVGEGHRTIGRIAWHIVTTIPEMMAQTGLRFDGVASVDAPVPDSAEQIAEAYNRAATELLEQVQAQWRDEDLEVEDDLYGEKWKRGLTLAILLHHEIHHRGQLTVLMRQAGLPVPGAYGPAKEEWAAYGAEPPAV